MGPDILGAQPNLLHQKSMNIQPCASCPARGYNWTRLHSFWLEEVVKGSETIYNCITWSASRRMTLRIWVFVNSFLVSRFNENNRFIFYYSVSLHCLKEAIFLISQEKVALQRKILAWFTLIENGYSIVHVNAYNGLPWCWLIKLSLVVHINCVHSRIHISVYMHPYIPTFGYTCFVSKKRYL